MPTPDPSLETIDFDSSDGLDEHHLAIRDQLKSTAPEDIRLQLPNLVETIREMSADPETVRFLLGVSFTRDYTPLDYRLERYHSADDDKGNQVEAVKVPVSSSHGYLTVVYPPDPQFDGRALRAALLTAVERNVHTLEADPTASVTGSRLADLWEQL